MRARTQGNTEFLPLTLLKLGAGVQIELVGMDERLTGIFVGMELGRYLVVRFPMRTGIQSKLNIKNRVTLRFVVGGAVYGFHSQILNTMLSPFLLVLLKFPEQIENVSLRQHQRVICFFPVRLSAPQGALSGHIIDISQGGCRMLFDSQDSPDPKGLTPDSSVEADFNILGTAGTHSVTCTVKNIQLDGTTMTLGLQFATMDFAVRTAIENYVKEAARHLEVT